MFIKKKNIFHLTIYKIINYSDWTCWCIWHHKLTKFFIFFLITNIFIVLRFFSCLGSDCERVFLFFWFYCFFFANTISYFFFLSLISNLSDSKIHLFYFFQFSSVIWIVENLLKKRILYHLGTRKIYFFLWKFPFFPFKFSFHFFFSSSCWRNSLYNNTFD